MDVSIDGSWVRSLATGDIFGEIALLRDTPRTATVIARTEVRLYVLQRIPFLEAVTGHPQSQTEAHALVHRRLTDPALPS